MMRGPTSLYFLGNRSIHTLPGSMTWSSTDTIQLRSYCFFWSAITALLLSNVEHSAGHGPGAGGSSDLEAGGDHVVVVAVSYTHLRAHETGRNLVCRLLLEKK